MFYLVYCTCMGIIRNIYHVVATMLCVFTQGRRCIVVKFPPHCCLYSVDWGFIMTLMVSQETRARWSNCRSTSTPAGPTSFSQWASSSIIVIAFQWHCNHQNVWSLWSLSYSTRFQNLNEANVILRWTYPWRPGRRRPTSTRGASPSSPALHSTERTQQIFTSFGTNV